MITSHGGGGGGGGVGRVGVGSARATVEQCGPCVRACVSVTLWP